MSKLILLWLTLSVTILYLAVPYSEVTRDYFLLADQQLTLQMHVWFICEKLILVVFAWIIANEATEYRGALKIFFWLTVLKFLDYVLCYNNVWVRIWDIPFSANTLCILIFGLTICYEWIWRKQI